MPDIDPAERDRLPPVWDLSQERQFLAGGCNQRFNFLLVIFGVFVAASAAARDHFLHCAILCVGAVLCTLLYVVMRRSFAELHLVTRKLQEDPTHPAAIVRRELPGRSPLWLMSDLIPCLCIGILVAAALAAMLTSRSHTGPLSGSMSLGH
jgi:fructose-specific phosphotransferase system IIC component